MIRRLLLNTAADLLTIWNWIVTGRWEPDMSDTADAPNLVYLEAYDDAGDTLRRIDCLLERTGPTDWQATPVVNVSPHEGLRAFIDRLPAGHTVSFIFHGDFDTGTFDEIVASRDLD